MGTGSVTTHFDVAYGSHARQSIDIYLPGQPARALILFCRGGAWRVGDKAEHRRTLMPALVQRTGCAAASVGYRLSAKSVETRETPVVRHPDHTLDLLAAIEFLVAWKDGSGHQPYDADRIVLIGHSVGALMIGSLWLVPPPKLDPSPAFTVPAALRRRIRGLAFLEPISDLDDMCDEYAEKGYAEWFVNERSARIKASPARWDLPPIEDSATHIDCLVVHSPDDELLTRRQADLMASRLDQLLSAQPHRGSLRTVFDIRARFLDSVTTTMSFRQQSVDLGRSARDARDARAPASPAGSVEPRRQGKRDEAIRKKIESDLARKRPASKRGGQKKLAASKAGTVSALKPSPALTVPDSITVSEASQLCAAKRTDCVLVVDEDEHLSGVITAKDLALRVVADGLDPRNTPVSAVMTKNPMVTRDTTSATDALQTMVSRGFRHLVRSLLVRHSRTQPVCNEEGDVVGLLDIAKVFYESLEKLERAYGSSQKLYQALEGVQSEWSGSAGQQANGLLAYVEALRDRMSFPDLGSILDSRTRPATVSARTTVRDCAKLMREMHTTAVIVLEPDGRKLAGIFTSKDIVLRCIAAGLDAKTCSVVRVMTPHPDTAPPTLSIQEALRKMHDGHYLNLPVVEETGELTGCVDVLKLTYATLEQINSIGAENAPDGADADGSPVWTRFFAQLGAAQGQDGDTESVVSDHQRSSIATPLREGQELRPSDSASAAGDDDPSELGTPSRPRHGRTPSSIAPSSGIVSTSAPMPDDGTYIFKLLAPGGTTHRFQARYDEFSLIRDIIAGKLSADPFFSSNSEADPEDFHIHYIDDDGDLVRLTADRDVADAVDVARKQGRDRVVLHLHGGKGWEGPVSGGAKELKAVPEAEDAEPEEKPKKRTKPSSGDDIFGLPKDLALPAAVAFLSVVILSVFAIHRSSK